MPLWNVLGYALGVGTALMSEKHAMLCTYAVEDAIDDHYAKQIDELNDKADEGELKRVEWKWDSEGAEGFVETIKGIEEVTEAEIRTYQFSFLENE